MGKKNSNYKPSNNKDTLKEGRTTPQEIVASRSRGESRSSSPRRGRKDDRKSDKDRFVCSAGKPTNDPRWYLNNPILSRDVGSIWFSKPIGSYLPPSAITTTPPTLQADQFEPGVLIIPTMTTWGGNVLNGNYDVSNDPINLTAQKLYQFVVHANSRNISYDKKDLLMTLMAVDGVYQLITEAIRAYRLTAQFDPENRYVAKLLEMMGWDPQNLRSNVAQFRYFINWAIARVNKFFVPAIFAMFPAHMSCYEHIYADRPSNKAQYIVKISRGVWIYDDATGAMDYCSKFQSINGVDIDWNVGLKTVATFAEAVTTQIAAIENAQYLGVMQGDLLKAFGVERMAQYAFINIDMPIAPVYDEEFMLKFHNADIAPLPSVHRITPTKDSIMVYRDISSANGNIIALTDGFIGATDLKAWRIAHGLMIDLPTHIPADASTVLLMSLYKLLGSDQISAPWHLGDNSGDYAVGQLPPEVLFSGLLYVDPNDLTKVVPIYTWGQTLERMAYLSRFETYPLLTQSSVANGSQVPIMWKTDNVTQISAESIRRMMEVIYWSLWASSEITTDVSRDTRV